MSRRHWINDRCQHGARIDDHDTHYDPDTGRFTCATTEARSA